MKQAGFWVFQVLVMVGVLAAFFSVFYSLDATTAAPTHSEGVVLADSDDVFFQSSSDVVSATGVFEHINEQRASVGAASVVPSATLADEARRRADEMQRELFYAHENPETGMVFSDALRQSGVSYGYACENLNLTFSTQAHLTVRDWLGSNAGHKECLLNEQVTHIGIATIDFPLPDGQPAYITVAIQASLHE
jgi:uncharacterized protein YkwD